MVIPVVLEGTIIGESVSKQVLPCKVPPKMVT